MLVEGFYQEVAVILKTQHEYRRIHNMRRWTRSLGNGRYPDHGVVRVYGQTVVAMFSNPPLVKTFQSHDQFFDALREAVDNQKTT